MFALTRQEKILIVCVMLSLVLGATVKHWRELRRDVPKNVTGVSGSR